MCRKGEKKKKEGDSALRHEFLARRSAELLRRKEGGFCCPTFRYSYHGREKKRGREKSLLIMMYPFAERSKKGGGGPPRVLRCGGVRSAPGGGREEGSALHATPPKKPREERCPLPFLLYLRKEEKKKGEKVGDQRLGDGKIQPYQDVIESLTP